MRLKKTGGRWRTGSLSTQSSPFTLIGTRWGPDRFHQVSVVQQVADTGGVTGEPHTWGAGLIRALTHLHPLVQV